MAPTPHTARPHVLHEASYRQLLDLAPTVAVLPWGATDAHNDHLPHVTDVVEATRTGAEAVAAARAQTGDFPHVFHPPRGQNR